MNKSRKAILSLFALCMALPCCAQLPSARLHTIFPPGGHFGTDVDVSLAGSDLDELSTLRFSHSNFTATALGSTSFRINIGSNVPPGLYEVRAIGRFGASNPRVFEVGALTELIEQDNASPEKPMPIELDCTINARTDVNGVDHYKFSGKEGQRILIRCVARELDSRCAPSLALYDSSGREVDRERREGLIDYTPAADGDFLLKVHDAVYGGGPDYAYRLSVGTFPHIDFVWPPVLTNAQSGEVVAYGRNLLGGSPTEMKIAGHNIEMLKVMLPTEDSPREVISLIPGATTIPFRVSSSNGVSNPVRLMRSQEPVIVEKIEDTNDHAITPPLDVWGRFYPNGDTDQYEFAAKKGEVYWLEVWSQRLGQRSDPRLVIQRISGNEKGGPHITDVQEINDLESDGGGREFPISTRDPGGRVEIKENGTYRISVFDLFNRRDDPRLAYRLTIEKEAPGFALFGIPMPAAPPGKDKREVFIATGLLRRGQSFPIKIAALRKGGFGGEIHLALEGLPSGIKAASSKIAAGKNNGQILLTASPDAPEWNGPIRVYGEAKAGDRTIRQVAQASTVLWNVPDYNAEAAQSRLTGELMLAVSGAEPAPIRVTQENIPEGAADGKIKVPFTIYRNPQFASALKLRPAGLSQLESLKEIEVDGKATNGAIELDLAQLKLPPGEHTFWLQCTAQGKYQNNPEAAKTADAVLKEAEKNAADLATAAKKAAEAAAEAAKTATQAETAAKTASETEAREAARKAAAASEAKQAAAKASSEAAAKAKEAEEKKQAAAARAKELAEKAKPRDVTIPVYSAPLRIKVLPSKQEW